jgi:hypothetical protein
MQFLHSNLFDDNSSCITNFRQDKRHRKCYITSNKGLIVVINIINSVVLKNIVDKPEKKNDKNETEESESSSAKGSESEEEIDSPSPAKKTVRSSTLAIKRSPMRPMASLVGSAKSPEPRRK